MSASCATSHELDDLGGVLVKIRFFDVSYVY